MDLMNTLDVVVFTVELNLHRNETKCIRIELIQIEIDWIYNHYRAMYVSKAKDDLRQI